MIKTIQLTALFCFFLLVSCDSGQKSKETTSAPVTGYVSVSLNFGEQVLAFDSLSLKDGNSLYEVLVQLDATEGGVSVIDTLYTGIGHLITGFDTVRNNNPYYWVYCLNNKKANKGVDLMELKDGDEISWYYTDGKTPCE